MSRLTLLFAVPTALVFVACSSSTNPAPRTPAVNIALGKETSASAVWQSNPAVGPAKAVDGSSFDDSVSNNFWLLPNRTPGWWQVDLGAEYLISSIEICNTNNANSNDRGTKDFRIEVQDSARQVVFNHAGTLPFTSRSSADHPIAPFAATLNKPVYGRYVKVYVDSWYPTRSDASWTHPVVASGNPANEGGGLNEVRVFAITED